MQVYTESDFTGTEIRSSRTVSVFNGNKRIGQAYKRNHAAEQLPPIDNWGNVYVTAAPQGFTYECKIMSGFPNTFVNYTCSTNVTEHVDLPEAGSFKTLTFGNSTCFLISNKPILVNIIVANDNQRPCLITMPALEEIEGEPMVYVPAAMENAQLVIVTNVRITVKSANETISEYVECPSHINTCIILVENLNRNQIYKITPMRQPFVVSVYIHGINMKGRGIGYPILQRTNKKQQTTTENADVKCGESTVLPGSSTEGPPPPLVLNTSCQCCSFKNYTVNLEETLKLLKDELYVHPKKTTLYLRSLISAPDHRVASKVMGYTCGCVLGIFGICLVILDIGSLLAMWENIKGNICNH
ncbi:uncharacterized protein LOC117341164 [Pecten maximus]|uniref:uncharacterized protein LOC117341164 n=1 Tax=Pecten maximus TaxID=6579 RepID=UPI0014580286|nr:uncharacterized protein LOC117341164 [Pecten maximus]